MDIDCIGSRESLAVLWNENVDFEALSFSKNLIRDRVREDSNNPLFWLLTSVYGHLETKRRMDFWNEVRAMRSEGEWGSLNIRLLEELRRECKIE